MSWRNVKLVFIREVRDQLRDRRTLFMIAILPLLLYPAMGIGMVHMTLLFSEQQRAIVILGADHLPEEPALLQDGSIVSNWFAIPAHADTLNIVTDSASLADKQTEGDDELLNEARVIAESVTSVAQLKKQARQLEEDIKQAKADDNPERAAEASSLLESVESEAAALKTSLSELYARSTMQVLVVVPEGFSDNLERFNDSIRDRSATNDDYDRPIIVRNSADDKSLIAFKRVQEAFVSWEEAVLERRLAAANLPASLPKPVDAAQLDVAKDEEKAANLWSKLFPALLIIMAVTGAFYPAIDIGAGEKERGTMETLLICPASRTEIVLGKFMTVMLFSVSTVILNIASMGLTGSHMHSVMGGAMKGVGDLGVPSLSALVWLVILLIPLSAFLSALCLSLAMFARSSKEGQYYLSPLLMVTLGLTVFCLSPAIEITPDNNASWFYCVLPIVGPALLLKGFLLNPANPGALYMYAIPVLVTSIAYSLMALWWAIDQFKREDILFREAERFELGLWIRHLLRDKEALPSFTEAGFCFVMIMFLQFGAMRYMRSPESLVSGLGMMKLLIVQQLAIIAIPAVMMALILTTRPMLTLRIRRPSLSMLGVALILPLALHPLSLELQARLSWFFPQLPSSVRGVLQTMGDGNQPLWFVLTAFAVAPAICEELAYRGFILSGFANRGRTWLAIGLSSFAFGIMHMIPQQVFNASLLGIVLGLLAIRSKSLFPCILFHFVFNSAAVLHGRFGPEAPTGGVWDWFVSVSAEGLRYRPLTIAIAVGIASALLAWLIRQGEGRTENSTDSLFQVTDVSTKVARSVPAVRD